MVVLVVGKDAGGGGLGDRLYVTGLFDVRVA